MHRCMMMFPVFVSLTFVFYIGGTTIQGDIVSGRTVALILDDTRVDVVLIAETVDDKRGHRMAGC